MIRDLVLYLLRQGCYSNEGDIVVLCAYLGQLARLRDALGSEVEVIIDERDQAELDDREDDEKTEGAGDISIQRVSVTRRVRLRTVDNYQGEEGRVVILSLVRNAGGLEDESRGFNGGMRPNIGFLKSENRTNVALSRAREGLYIFGNADNLTSRSQMWRSIIEELQSIDCVGPALPIACHRHPDRIEHVSEPGILPQIAPDGGCLRPCETRLECGHNCPFKCHCDDPKHLTVVCSQPCRRLCARDHPCHKLCSAACGECVFPIANVTLPCGHLKASVKCYQLDKLEDVFCPFQMKKALPNCEHTAVMPCGRDPSDYLCTSRCGLVMNCCSKSCNAPCSGCQKENVPQEQRVSRLKHRQHPCEKTLHCGHTCQEKCSEDHRHTERCTEKCRQICVHAQCRQSCSVPCAPCQEPCAWVCAHHSCPVPCGSVCVRLPCDVPCTNVLQCGHRCPSVCGEDCSIQACPVCSPDHKKEQVVDLILSRTLEDILPESGALDDLVITIPACGHVFTVETLDGHTGLNDFYTRDKDDTKWVGLKTPVGFIKHPACPSCRAPISCNRYGRITKRAALDVLERNVASHMSRSLDRWLELARNFDEEGSKAVLLAAVSSLVIPHPKEKPKERELKVARANILNGADEKPVSDNDIRAENPGLHFIDSTVITAWRKATHPLFNYYKEIVRIANTRSAHTKAWEASFSFLYEQEIQAGLKDPARMPRSPREHAMRMAKLQVGQHRPLADRRFLVEAFWATIHIRLAIIRLAQLLLEEIGKDEERCPPFHVQQWATYIGYLLKTCSSDVAKVQQIADNSKARRQIIKSVLLSLRIELESFRFNLYMCKKSGTFKDPDVRNQLREDARGHGQQCAKQMNKAIVAYLEGTESLPEESAWVEENFVETARTFVEEWETIEESIRRDTFYQPVLLEEKMDILRAFNFPTTGHFYTCPNGHIYTITECGGAMERSRCPECGEVIGGSHHRLESTNERSTEFEELARRLDPRVMASPWANPH